MMEPKMEKEIWKDADRKNLDLRVKHRNQQIDVHVYVWTNAGALVHEPNRQMGGLEEHLPHIKHISSH